MVLTNARLGTGLVLFAFVFCHLLNLSFGIHSLTWMNKARVVFLDPWQSWPGLVLFYSAAIGHIAINAWTIWQRRVLKLKPWHLLQMLTGLAIPVLLVDHFLLNRGVVLIEQTNADYYSIQALYWMLEPWRGVLQVAALLVTWIHGTLGIYHWLKLTPWFPRIAGLYLGFTVLIPALALAGFVASGKALQLEAAAFDGYAELILDDANWTNDMMQTVTDMRLSGFLIAVGLIVALFAAREIRRLFFRLTQAPELIFSDGRRLQMPGGATIQETLNINGIELAAVCGGRGRCTTCRVRIIDGLEKLPKPNAIEAAALHRIDAHPSIRLACQCRPVETVTVAPLMPSTANAADGRKTGQLFGQEREIAVLFLDLRGSTKLGEERLPFDVLFILNQFFQEMTQAIEETGGHFSQFLGDGLMAIYGLNQPIDKACRQAIAGAEAMFARLERTNEALKNDLPVPLQIGIGIHAGIAIVGEMGPPRGRTVSAIGDTVNTAARLEALCKPLGCRLVLSAGVVEHAGLSLPASYRQEAEIRGRDEKLPIYALDAAPVSPA